MTDAKPQTVTLILNVATKGKKRGDSIEVEASAAKQLLELRQAHKPTKDEKPA